MGKDLCLLHANCQGDALKQLLEASPDFAAKFEIRHLRNYEKQALDQGLLESTRLFLHQDLVDQWGPISTAEVLPRLAPNVEAICVPNCVFKGYWPHAAYIAAMREFGDSLLESLLARGLSDQEILSIYLKGAPAIMGDVEQIAQESLRREREKETHTPIKYVDLMAEHWRREQLFLTVNHPGIRLLVHIARNIIKMLGLRQIPESFIRAYTHPHNEFWMAIHPALGKMLDLPFVFKERRYPCFGAELTHHDYTLVYLSCRRNNLNDFPSALAAHAKKLHGEALHKARS